MKNDNDLENVKNELLSRVVDNYASFASKLNVERSLLDKRTGGYSDYLVYLVASGSLAGCLVFGLAMYYYYTGSFYVLMEIVDTSARFKDIFLFLAIQIILHGIISLVILKIYIMIFRKRIVLLKYYFIDKFIDNKLKHIKPQKDSFIENTAQAIFTARRQNDNLTMSEIVDLIIHESVLDNGYEFKKSLLENLSSRKAYTIDIFDYQNKIIYRG